MSSEQIPTVSVEEKKTVAVIFDKVAANQAVTVEEKTKVGEINEKFWKIKNNNNGPIAERKEAFRFIEMCHRVLGRKFDQSWEPKEKKQGFGGKSWTASNQQRSDNCDGLISYLKVLEVWDAMSPYEQAMTVAKAWGSVKQ